MVTDGWPGWTGIGNVVYEGLVMAWVVAAVDLSPNLQARGTVDRIAF